jgi:hypothetical protein
MAEFKHFFGVAPSDQNALDLFAGEWSSQPPPTEPQLTGGSTPLFDDPRISWAQRHLIAMGLVDGFSGRDVLELGPLEAGHTYVLDRLKAKSITCIEANARAYLKCLISKEVFGITRARFLLGDGLEYLRAADCHYDIGVACGVLYHMTNPVELLELLARRCDALFLWTVFYDPDFVAKSPGPGAMFSDALSMEHAGFEHTVHRYNYGPFLDSESFSGGGDTYSYWMEKPEILTALRHFGFTDLRTVEEPNVYGPALMLTARK